jgi:hypothetical protein
MLRVLDISGCELRREVCQTLVEGMIVSLVALTAAVVLVSSGKT